MKELRKTLAYKFCGYSFIIIELLAIIVSCSPSSWSNFGLYVVFFCIPFIVLPFVIAPIFLISTVIAIKTKDKFMQAKTNVGADIGFVLMALLLISCFIFWFRVAVTKY